MRRRLRVAVLCTGAELRAPGAPLQDGAIWNVNEAQLRAALDRPWIALTRIETLPDCRDRIAGARRAAAQDADLVITTGGVSVGDADHVHAALRRARERRSPRESRRDVRRS